MQVLAREAMQEGAMGIGSSLIYAPAFYAKTDELIELLLDRYGIREISFYAPRSGHGIVLLDRH